MDLEKCCMEPCDAPSNALGSLRCKSIHRALNDIFLKRLISKIISCLLIALQKKSYIDKRIV